MSFDDRELEEIRKKKLMELQKRMEEERKAEELRKKQQLVKETILKSILTSEARARLANVKLVRPELAEQVENYLIALAQAGRIARPLTDAEVKEILARLAGETRREGRINIKERGW
ncbi:DNA-binding protein [Ignicoccus hospitalis]|uniref:DNA-binding protein Igni_0285 n=1 Tax=Ignicoccus hospitalis (strain KIN4/I / DSM 18386 / JCM 14125) TaxID=453591 RepID=A8A966_IGNH4|nr:DNA-binding protein [Ignicoccus hospitalis]ABU81468.1 DNA-binding TFAR19-related protein [Ignicoccus hospitalis KIN4/I]HIH90225.1 DNA-binding protein [Desulfurococcaceae archaeon]